MRTLIDIPEGDIEQLDALAAGENRSRASMIREAIGEYLLQRKPAQDAFGLWGKRKIDGLDYEKKIRAEW